MQADRRQFLKWTALAAAGIEPLGAESAQAGEHTHPAPRDQKGVLVDLTQCIGCRRCEFACKKANGIEPGDPQGYEDTSVFRENRRPGPDAFTVINRYPPLRVEDKPIHVKINCLHCVYPSCASACIVGALRQQENGAVTYDASKCIGCRYCMVACPFQIPAYEYDNALAPRVRKCELCFADRTSRGRLPACVEACPRNVMKFGRRSDLLEWAHARIRKCPEKYVDHIYGEHEVGGTSWMYLSAAPFGRIGFLDVPTTAPPALTETIQHGVFSPRLGVPPLILYGLLGTTMYLTQPRRAARAAPPPEIAQPHPTPHHHQPTPVSRSFFTPGVGALVLLVAIGVFFALKRFVFGLASTTNLTQQYPWGLWIGVDVASGVALAAGGFTSAFLAHVLRRHHYHAIVRPALLTAMLGYTFVVLGLLADLGRYYNVWHPMLPNMWQGNSVLFEVGMCVMCYLNVLYLEFAPIACERLMKEQKRFPRLSRWAGVVNQKLERVMFLLIIAGCCLSCLHQSSLGNLMVIAPTKLHPLWWTPLSPLLFLLSAVAVGFPMIIWESLFASWSLGLEPEMNVLSPLARFVPFTLGTYALVKFGDLIHRGAYAHLFDGTVQSTCWLAEVAFGVLLPLALLIWPRTRKSPRAIFISVTLIVLGVVFNRVNVFMIGYRPPFATRRYVPSIGEFAVTIGLGAALMLTYRVVVTLLPVIAHRPAAEVA